MTLDEFDRTDYAQMPDNALDIMEFVSTSDHLDEQEYPVFSQPYIFMGADLYYLAAHVASCNEPFTLPSGRKLVYDTHRRLTYPGKE